MRIVTDSDINERQRDVGVIIVNYNAGPLLADCVTRVLSQANIVVVIDNDSHDDSLDELERALPSGANVKILRQDRNLGFATACNIGITQAPCEYLLFLNTVY